MSALNEIMSKIEKNKFSENHCFLCGVELHNKNKTLEHVIPRWAQSRYNLWDQVITLLNGTKFRYRNLRIPCCERCNNHYLEPIENTVLEAVKGGIETFRDLSEETLFYWLGKIYFGLMYKEMFLAADQKNANNGTILTPDYIKSFKSLYIFLQGIRGLHKFKSFFPASIYIFETQQPQKVEDQWDFMDNHLSMFIACRLGSIGLIAVLQDGGITKQLEDLLSDFSRYPLHPLQFRELAAKIFYKSTLINRTPKYISTEINGIVETIQLPIMGLSSKPVLDDWDNDEYGKVLSQFTGVPITFTNPEPGKVWTWMVDMDGKPIFMDIDQY